MKIFGIGLNKTGTKTLGSCFNIFGLKNKSYDLSLLVEYSQGNIDSVFQVSDAFDSFEDWPWPLLYKEFDKRYPYAKFVLTVRKDPDTWFNSLCRHADRTGPTHAREIVYHHSMPHLFREEHIQIYNRHIQEVLIYFRGRENKLLTLCWENGDRWERLAGFLGLPVPDVSFPHENQAPSLTESNS
jgi:hypothetical protein